MYFLFFLNKTDEMIQFARFLILVMLAVPPTHLYGFIEFS